MDNKLVQVSKRLQENINFTILSDEISIDKTAEVISNKIYNLKIIDNQKTIGIDFIQSIGSTFALHNTDENAHANIVSSINNNIFEINNQLSNKVDAIEGKSLSTNDLTDTLKSNYDNAHTNSHVHENKTLLDNLTSSGNGNYYLTNDGTYKSVNPGMIINSIGTTSSNQTLPANQITKASFNGTPVVTLPSVSDSTKETCVVLDFTTTNSSYPTINTTGISLKWSDKNKGVLPAFSTLSGIRNRIRFKTIDGGATWEAEYTSYGGVETTFAQPVLSSDGTLGGNSFAVYADRVYLTNYAYLAFDNNSSTNFNCDDGAGHYLIFYNPVPLKVSQLSITNRYDYNYTVTGYILYGSNDNSNWTLLVSGTNNITNAGATYNVAIPESNRGFYKYYKFYTTATNAGNFSMSFMQISATYIAT